MRGYEPWHRIGTCHVHVGGIFVHVQELDDVDMGQLLSVRNTKHTASRSVMGEGWVWAQAAAVGQRSVVQAAFTNPKDVNFLAQHLHVHLPPLGNRLHGDLHARSSVRPYLYNAVVTCAE